MANWGQKVYPSDYAEIKALLKAEVGRRGKTEGTARGQSVGSMASMAKQDNYKKERTETALSFHFSDFGMRGYISMVKPSGLFLRFSFSFW